MPVITRTYTLDADFNEGTLTSVTHDTAPGGGDGDDQLQLSQGSTTEGFLMVNSSTLNALVRIRVTDGAFLGVYSTAPTHASTPGSPGHIVVDSQGNTFSTNRAHNTIGTQGAWSKIGVVVGGTRTDSTGVPDATGQYLAPPYNYSTAVDRLAPFGLIRTSIVAAPPDSAEILPWTTSTDGGDGTANDTATVLLATDEEILLYQRVTATGSAGLRGSAISPIDGSWWVISYTTNSSGRMFKFDRDTGLLLKTIPAAALLTAGGLACAINPSGILMAVGANTATGDLTLIMRYDTVAETGPTYHGMGAGVTDSFAVAADTLGGFRVTVTTALGPQIKVVNSDGTVTTTFTVSGATGNFLGLAVDVTPVEANHMYVTDTSGTPNPRVYHLSASGTLLTTVTMPASSQPGSLSIDHTGKVWVLNGGVGQHAVAVQRFTPGDTSPDLTVPLPSGSTPYSPSKFVGQVNISSRDPTGTWTVICDGGASLINWQTATWTSEETQGSTIDVEVRASDDQTLLPGLSYAPILNDTTIFPEQLGQYIQIKVDFTRSTTVQIGPILYDLTINGTLTNEGATSGFFYDGKHGGWWQDEYVAAKGPTSLAVFDADDPDDRRIAIGCADGFLRIFDRGATDDDGDRIFSAILIGPFMAGLPDFETRVSHLITEFAGDQEGVTFSWYVSDDPTADITLLTPVATGTLPAGLSTVKYERARGLYVWLLIEGTVDGPWAYEAGSCLVEPGGRARQRP